MNIRQKKVNLEDQLLFNQKKTALNTNHNNFKNKFQKLIHNQKHLGQTKQPKESLKNKKLLVF